MAYETLLFEQKDSIAWMTINRPQALNALNEQVLGEISDCLSEVSRNQSVRVLVMTGAGDKAFVAGADIKAMLNMTPEQAQAFARTGQEVFSQIEGLPLPVIAAVNGFALGGGLELAMGCDIIVASENAKLGLPEVTLGLIPGFGGTQRLSRAVGLYKAREMVFTGDMISAKEAAQYGLVNRVVPQEELEATVAKMAKAISTRGPLALAEAKAAMNLGFDLPLEEGLAIEADHFGRLFSTQDRREGVQAFLEKRPPNFQGC